MYRRILRFDASATGLHPTDAQRTAMVERTSKLRRKIFAWRDIQAMFFPVVESLRKLEDAGRARAAGSQPIPGVKVHEIALWLPSALKRRAGGASAEDGCTDEILMYEYRMRVGEANEALHNIRRHLLVRAHLYQLKDRYARGVKANTRSNTKIELVDERIRRAAAQYRDAWGALRVLGKKLKRREWEATLKELGADDVRGMPRTTQGNEARQRGEKVPRKKRRTEPGPGDRVVTGTGAKKRVVRDRKSVV